MKFFLLSAPCAVSALVFLHGVNGTKNYRSEHFDFTLPFVVGRTLTDGTQRD